MSGAISTTCRDCGARHGGRSGHCVACCRTFSSDSAFDRHLASRVHAGCLDPATMRDKHDRPVFTFNAKPGFWQLAFYGHRPDHWSRSPSPGSPRDLEGPPATEMGHPSQTGSGGTGGQL